jgi:capsular exopolysaccharide synthesis family protein
MTTVNLAVALAQTGKRVLLVDADLRHPTVDKVFDLANEAGLSNLLINPELNPETVMVNIKDDVLQIPVGRGLWVLPSGSPPPNPAELIGSGEMQKLITRLKELVDIVVFDSPPLLVVTDASLLARQVEATLLVVEAGRNRAHICQQARERLSWIGVEPVGVVLNKQASKHHGGYYYYYQNSYYHPSPNGREKQSKRRSFLRWPLKKR